MSSSFEVAGFVVLVEGKNAIIRFHDQPKFGDDVPYDTTETFVLELSDGGRLSGCDLTVSLDNMPAISSSQLGALLGIHKSNSDAGKLRVQDVPDMVRRLFDTAGMAAFFDY